jgi:hypothetical protein
MKENVVAKQKDYLDSWAMFADEKFSSRPFHDSDVPTPTVDIGPAFIW